MAIRGGTVVLVSGLSDLVRKGIYLPCGVLSVRLLKVIPSRITLKTSVLGLNEIPEWVNEIPNLEVDVLFGVEQGLCLDLLIGELVCRSDHQRLFVLESPFGGSLG